MFLVSICRLGILVSCLLNTFAFAGENFDVFQDAREVAAPKAFGAVRASNAEKRQRSPGPEGCDENGPALAFLLGHRSMKDMLLRRALAAGHFDRNKCKGI